MSHNTVSTFVFWIFRLPRGLEILSWTFFNSPYRVDSKDTQFCIIWWNMDQDMCKILPGEVILKVNILCLFLSCEASLYKLKNDWLTHRLTGLPLAYLYTFGHLFSLFSPIFTYFHLFLPIFTFFTYFHLFHLNHLFSPIF